MANSSTSSASRTTKQYWIQRSGAREGWWPWGLLPAMGLVALLFYGLFQTAPAIEADTAERVRSKLSASGLTDFTVEADGQEVLIRAAGSADDAAHVHYLANGVSCETWVAGERTCPNTVRVEMSGIEAPAEPQLASALPRFHNFDLRESGSGLVVTGEVPDENARGTILAAARGNYSNVTDELNVTGDAASDGFDWAVDRAWPLLAATRNAAVAWKDGKLSASGSVDGATEASIRSDFATTAYPARLGKLTLESGSQAASCNDQFAAALSESSIQFQSGSAEISPASEGLIAQLAGIAAGCPIGLQIEGHTDNVGSAEVNEYLSLARAEAVTKALALRGIPTERMSARGFGPKQPIAVNTTAAGRALNRRIEIKAANLTTQPQQ